MFRFSQSKHPNFLRVYRAAENVFSEIPLVKRRRRMRKIFKLIKYSSLSILFLFLIVFLSLGYQVLSLGDIYRKTISGKNNLEQALFLAQEENFKTSLEFIKAAQNDLEFTANSIEEIRGGIVISRIKILRDQIDDAKYLIDTALALADALEQGVNFGYDLQGLLKENKKLSFSKFSREEKALVLGRIYASSPELEGVKKNLDLAQSNLGKVDGLIFYALKWKISELEEKIAFGQNLLAAALPMSKILPHFAGYPEKSSYLVILQNSDELRPTGGFIGTYGIMETESGEILRFDTHDIYHMDMPVKDKVDVAPPEPIKKYLVPKWYMRDANWSPDWPEAAEKILWFYDLEDKLLSAKNQINNFSGEFDGVIGITPEFVTDLLKITGPVVIEGVEYNPENFTQLLEYRVEKGYVQLGVPSWERKEVIGDILEEIKIRVLDLPSAKWQEVISVLDKSFLEKNILIYLKDGRLQELMDEKNWSGKMVETDKDYLMVVDANMGALKTDAVMRRNMNYSLEQRANGTFAKLQINYAHTGGTDWRTSAYKTYTRVYVPLGSKLINYQGGEGVISADEAGKTYFGAYFTVDPGKIGSLYFEYKLPDTLSRDGYELYVQKQPGKDVDSLSIDLKLANEVNSYSPAGFFASHVNNMVSWETDLKTDRIFKVN